MLTEKGEKKETKIKHKIPMNFVFLGIANLVAVGIIIFFIIKQYNKIFSSDQNFIKPNINIHYYNNKNISLKKVLVRVFVFQPQDDQTVLPKEWRSDLVGIFDWIKRAHQDQFLGLSNFQYVIYPEIIRGKYDREYYDQESLKIGEQPDEKQLNLIMAEIEQGIEDNELNKISFSPFEYTYLVNQIIYTGSNQPFADSLKQDLGEVLDNKIVQGSCCPYVDYYELPEGDKIKKIKRQSLIAGYTNEEKYNNTSVVFSYMLRLDNSEVDPLFRLTQRQATLIYHEILHTLGVPEGYSYENLLPFTDDIMGAGLYRVISINHISTETKKNMGLTGL